MTDIPDVSEHAHYGVIYEDRHGSIWIGVNGTGLLQIILLHERVRYTHGQF